MKLAIEQSLAADPAAHDDYAEFSQVLDFIQATNLPEVEPPNGFRAAVMARVEAEIQVQQKPSGNGFLEALAQWFGQPRRQVTGALAGAAAVVIVIGAFMIHPRSQVQSPYSSENFGPSAPSPAPAERPVEPVILAVVTTTDMAGNSVHNIRVRVAYNSVVNAYAVNSTDQITDPSARSVDSQQLLSEARDLTPNQILQIPVTLSQTAEPGAMLNVVVTWHGVGNNARPHSEVVFSPANAGEPASPMSAAPSSGKFFDCLQAIASAYHITTIADVDGAPTGTGQTWTPGDSVTDALASVASGAGYVVMPISNDTYYLYHKH